MHTSNDHERELVASLIDFSLEVDLIAITLVNNENPDDKYQGKGVLYMKADGQFYLKFFNDEYLDQSQTMRRLFAEPRTYPIYSMEGTDYNGKRYSCNYLSTGSPILNVSELDLKGKIRAQHSMSFNSKIIFAGEYRLPIDKISDIETRYGGRLWYTDNKEVWEIILSEDLKVLFSKFNNYTEAILVGKYANKVDNDILERVVSTFDFLTGKETEPVLVSLGMRSHYFYGRRNMLLANSTFESPLPMSHNRGAEFTANHNSLFRTYFDFIGTPEGAILTDIHKRIVSASRGYIFALGLVVSIQIENLCKLFYSDRYVPDEAYRSQLLEAIEVLNASEKGPFKEIINRLKSSIPSKDGKSINVKNILKRLSEEKIINAELIKPWVKIRNSTAHADNISGEGWSKFLDEAFLCINLYYTLVFNVIGYNGVIRYYKDCHNSYLITPQNVILYEDE